MWYANFRCNGAFHRPDRGIEDHADGQGAWRRVREAGNLDVESLCEEQLDRLARGEAVLPKGRFVLEALTSMDKSHLARLGVDHAGEGAFDRHDRRVDIRVQPKHGVRMSWEIAWGCMDVTVIVIACRHRLKIGLFPIRTGGAVAVMVGMTMRTHDYNKGCASIMLSVQEVVHGWYVDVREPGCQSSSRR